MNQCESCSFNIRAPCGDICGEGLSNEHNDCPFYKDLPTRPLPPKHIRDIIMNPYEYWNRVPKYVRGILPHKSLVMTDVGLCIFSHPTWLILNKSKDGWLICPKLIRYLKNYSQKNKVYIYPVIVDSASYREVSQSYGAHYHYKRDSSFLSLITKGEDISLYILCSSTTLSYESKLSRKWKFNGDLQPFSYTTLYTLWEERVGSNTICIPLVLKSILCGSFVHTLENLKY